MEGKPLVSNTIMQSLDVNNTASIGTSQQLRAGYYARVSTSRQENEETIESQVDEIKRKAKESGHVLNKKLCFEDNGWSGELLARPALDALRDAVQGKEIDVLYLYDLGRLSRVFLNQLILKNEIKEANVQLISLHDINADSPEQLFAQNVMGLFHDYERIKIAERMRRGKMYKAKSGILINGSAIDGYDYVKKTETTPTHYVINEKRAEVIRLIYRWFCVERVSLREIMKRLYDKGIPPKKGKSDFWTKGPIERILKCESYFTGIVYYNKSEAVVAKNPINHQKYKKIKRTSRRVRPKEEWIPYQAPILIEDYALFETAQEILEYNKKYAKKNRKYDYLLSGLVYCGCGNKRAGDGYRKGQNHYYRCAERIYKYPLEGKCKLPGVSAIVLDQQFWNEFVKFITNPEMVLRHVVQWVADKNDTSQVLLERKRIDDGLLKLKEEEARYAKAYGTGDLEFEQFKGLMKDVKKRRKLFTDQQAILLRDSTIERINKIPKEAILKEIIRIIEKVKSVNKRELIHDIIDKIIIKERREVEVWGSFSLPALNMAYEPIRRNCRSSECGKVHVI